jgi:hypothetical protein
VADLFGVLAGLVVVAHMAFVGFAAFGGLLVIRRPWIAMLHLPGAAWASYVEFSGELCPLTPLESALRRRAGLDDYAGDFVARYLLPVLYPEGLTRDAQIVIGLVVVAVNLAIYGWAIRMRTRRAVAQHG